MSWLLAVILKPFYALLILSIAAPFRYAVARWMKDGRLKRLLLTRLN